MATRVYVSGSSPLSATLVTALTKIKCEVIIGQSAEKLISLYPSDNDIHELTQAVVEKHNLLKRDREILFGQKRSKGDRKRNPRWRRQ